FGLLTGEQEAPQQRTGLVGREARGAPRRLQHALTRPAARAELVRVLGEVADLHVVPRAEPPRRQLTPPREGLDQRGLAAAVGPHQRDMLAALQPQLRVLE